MTGLRYLTELHHLNRDLLHHLNRDLLHHLNRDLLHHLNRDHARGKCLRETSMSTRREYDLKSEEF